MRTQIFKEMHCDIDIVLFFFSEGFPPIFKLIRVFDLPCHSRIEYN